MVDVFLCHSKVDAQAVAQIGRRLEKEKGLTPWLDAWNLVAGQAYTPAIEAVLKDCRAIAVFVGESGRSPYQNEEIQLAFNTRGKNGVPLIPVLLPGASQEAADGMLSNRTWVHFRRVPDDERALNALITGINGLPPGDFQDDETGTPVTEVRRSTGASPYRALAAYDVDDADLFFGREAEIEKGVSFVESTLTSGAPRFLAIVGGPGSGKSSLVRAGLAHALAAKHPDWKVRVFTPGIEPLESLAVPVLKLARPVAGAADIDAFAASALKSERALQKELLGSLNEGLALLVVDQFEEVFTQGKDEEVRKQFIANLLCAARDSSSKAIIVICLRSDLYGRCAKYDTLADVIAQQQILLGPMNRANLRRAIEEPAKAAGARVHPALTALLVDDCEAQPSPLPLLQLVLNRLWDKRTSDGVIPQEAYESGRLAGAINDHAEAVVGAKDEQWRSRCMSLFLKLVEPLDDNRYVRKKVPLDSLLPAGGPDAVQQFEEMIGQLAGEKGRLITIEASKPGPVVEVSHEALLRGWKALSLRLDENSDFLLWKKRLSIRMQEFAAGDDSSLLTGLGLDRAVQYLTQRPADHTLAEETYIRECVRRRLVSRLKLYGTAAVVFLAVAGASYLAYRNYRKAGLSDLIAKTGDLIQANNQSELAVVLALHAARKDPAATAILEEAVQGRMVNPPLTIGTEIKEAALSDDGSVVAAIAGNSALIWKARPSSGEAPRWGTMILAPVVVTFDNNVDNLALSADGALVAARTGNNIVFLKTDGTAAGKPLEVNEKLAAMALDVDGSHLAYATESSKKVFWTDVKSGTQSPPLQAAHTVRALAINPKSRSDVALAFAVDSGDGLVQVWQPASGKMGPELKHPFPTVNYARFSESGEVLGTATAAGKAYRWELAANPSSKDFSEPGKTVLAAALSGDGNRVATYAGDGTITLWSRTAALLHYHQPGSIIALSLDRSGSRLITVEKSGIRVHDLDLNELEQRAWDLIRATPVANLSGCTEYLHAACKEYWNAAQHP